MYSKMKVTSRLGLAAVGSLVASILLGLCAAHVLSRVAVADFRNLSPEIRAKMSTSEILDARDDSLKFALLLVPLTLAVVWWRQRQKKEP